MEQDRKIIVLAGIMGMCFWFWDAFVDSVIFQEGSYLDHLIFTITLHELYDRIVFFILFATLCLFGTIAIRKQSQIQQDLLHKEAKIRQDLKEKETLLQEIHHRVKNNLQVIASLLRLQANKIEDLKYQEIFKITENRIRAIALVHEKMYQAESIAQVDFVEYINSLTKALVGSMKSDTQLIKIRLQLEPLSVDANQAIHCGLILNEILSNAFRHAFPENLPGEISITEKLIDKDTITLEIADNGVGLSKNFNLDNHTSLGFQLVKSLVKDQLRGVVKFESNGGTRVQIIFRRGSKL